MLNPFIQNRNAIPNFDACFKEEVQKPAASFQENSFCKPFVEDETIIGGPSFALDDAEKRLNNPVNITLHDSVTHYTAETPLVFRRMKQKRCTQFFQNRRPTPIAKDGVPRPLLLPSPFPCQEDRQPCMAQLFSLHMGREDNNSPTQDSLKKQNNQKIMNQNHETAEEKSIWNSGTRPAFSFGCLTPATDRSRIACSPVHGFVFDSPVSPLRVEQRENDSDPTPPTCKRKTKKRFFNLSRRQGPGSARKFDDALSRSFKKRRLSPTAQIMRRETPLNSPACSGIFSKSSFHSGKKIFQQTPVKFSLTPDIMMNSPVELTRDIMMNSPVELTR